MNRKRAGLLALALLLPACAPEPTAAGESSIPPTAVGAAHGVSTNAGITIVDLGILPGGGHSEAMAVNSQGTITGYSQASSGSFHLVRWKRGGPIEDLGQLGGLGTFGVAIDDAEEIVGSYSSIGALFNWRGYPGSSERAFYWNGVSGFQTLPGNGPSRATGVQRINNGTRTKIVGCDGNRVAVWLESGAGFQLSRPALPGGWLADSACATAVNPKGDYTGMFLKRQPPTQFGAFTYTSSGGAFVQLPPGNAQFYTEAHGQSVIPRRIVGTLDEQPTLWATPISTPIVLGPKPTNHPGVAMGVNNRTEVAGWFGYWNSDVGLIDLPDLAGSLPGVLSVRGINDSTEVVGSSINPLGQFSATLWLPRDTAQVITVMQLPGTTTHLPPKVSYLPSGFINDGILSRPGFNATLLDPNLITLGDGLGHLTRIARSATGAPKAVPQDVNGDGVLDLKVSFSKAQLISDGVLTPASYQFEIAYMDVTGLPVTAHYPIWVQ